MIKSSFFQGRNVFIVTKHGKEKVISPLLSDEFNISSYFDPTIDTDQFGTFSGEKEREEDPISILRRKCDLAAKYADIDLIIASEGSFGQHPQLFFTSANEEFLMLRDRKNDLELLARILSTDTNSSGTMIGTFSELKEFAIQIGFPEHGILLKKSKDDTSVVKKGIVKWEDLEKGYILFNEKFGSVYAETDMRALYNPTRMKVIEQCTKKLIELMNSCCPKCSTPGFQVTSVRNGLACSQCSFPTRSIKSLVYSCNRCQHEHIEEFPNGKMTEDPTYCDVCNP
jgi:hypothetical protein